MLLSFFLILLKKLELVMMDVKLHKTKVCVNSLLDRIESVVIKIWGGLWVSFEIWYV